MNVAYTTQLNSNLCTNTVYMYTAMFLKVQPCSLSYFKQGYIDIMFIVIFNQIKLYDFVVNGE